MPQGNAIKCLTKVVVALGSLIDVVKDCRDVLPFDDDELLDVLTEFREEVQDEIEFSGEVD